MRRHSARSTWGALIALCVLTGSASDAAGLRPLTEGAKASAMGSAFVAVADDASALAHNPAGVARLQGLNVLVGVGPSLTKTDLDGRDPVPGRSFRSRSRDRLLVAPHAFVTRPVSDGIVVGLALTQPARLATDWFDADAFAGRFVATTVDVDVSTLSPTLAIEALPRVALGVALDVSVAEVRWSRRVPFLFPDAVSGVIDLAEETFDATGDLAFGVRAGVLIDRDATQIGLTVDTGSSTTVSGDPEFTFMGVGFDAADAELANEVPRGVEAHVAVERPLRVAVGVARQLGESVRASVQAAFDAWSGVDAFRLTHADRPDLDAGEAIEYDDTFAVGVGIEFTAGEKLRLRGGYAHETSPLPEAAVGPVWVDSDAHRVSVGFGYAYEGWTFDVSHALSFHAPLTSENDALAFDAAYDQTGWDFALSLGYVRF